MNNQATRTVLDAIKEALNATTRTEELTFLSIIVSIIFIFSILALILKGTQRRKTRITVRNRYEKLIRKLNLTINELDLVDELSAYLKEPGKKYLLLTNRGTFRHAAEQLTRASTIRTDLLDSLAEKLSFSQSTDQTPDHTTKTLQANTAVKLSFSTGETIDADIYSVSEANLLLKADETIDNLSQGDEIELFSCSYSGIAFYRLKVNKVKGNLIEADHEMESEPVKKKVHIKVFIQSEDEDYQDHQESVILLLSQDAALIVNTREHELHPEEDIRIYLSNDVTKNRFANASVTRLIKMGKFAVVKFKHIR